MSLFFLCKRLLAISLLLFLITSCVQNRKVVYIQKDDLHSKELPLDSVVRIHAKGPWEYKVQPGDVLSIKLESLTKQDYNFFSQDISKSAQQNIQSANAALFGELVDEGGEIEFPVLGKVKVGGMSSAEIEKTIGRLMDDYIENPIVKVKILNFRFTMLGEVNEEKTVSTFNTKVSLLEAIGLAGGLGDLADRSKIKIIRSDGNELKTVYVNLLDEDLLESPYYYVSQNDVIVVPALKQRPYRKYFRDNTALILSTLTTTLLILNIITN